MSRLRHTSPSGVCTAMVWLALAGCAENLPPAAPGLTLTPEVPTTTDDLVVAVNSPADPEEDPVTLTLRWFVDGEPTAFDGTIVPASATQRGQVWSVLAEAYDGTVDKESGELVVRSSASQEVGVVNTPPEAVVTLSPELPTADDDVLAQVTLTDADGDVVSARYTWTLDGEDTVLAGARLPADQTRRGDVWSLTVVPEDGASDGVAVTAGVTIDNLAPRITGFALAPDPMRAADALTATATTEDADDDEVLLQWTWLVDGKVLPKETTATLPGETLVRGQTVQVQVTPWDDVGPGRAFTSPVHTVVNTPPAMAGATLSVLEPREADVLTCEPVELSDIDGDPTSITVRWFVDGEEIIGAGDTLSGVVFDRGQTISCAVVANDGFEDGPAVGSPVVWVVNTPPVAGEVSFVPELPTAAAEVSVAMVDAVDVDGDAVQHTVRWFLDEVLVSEDEVLSADLLVAGASLTAEVTPTDGLDAGLAVTAGPVVVGDAVPVVHEVVLSPAQPGVLQPITATVLADDPDGEAVSLAYVWSIDGAVVDGVAGEVLPAGTASRGQSVSVQVTPTAGALTGEPLVALPVVLVNTPPSLASATVSPDPLTTSDEVQCVAEGLVDPDGDTITQQVTWNVAGVPTGVPAPTLPASFTARGNSVSCTVVPSDGVMAGLGATSLPVVVGNSAPTVGAVSFSPANPTPFDTVTAVLTDVVDADGDAVTTTVQWWSSTRLIAEGPSVVPAAQGLVKEEGLQARVVPSDGAASGAEVQSATVALSDSPPVVQAVSVAPLDPFAAGTVTDTWLATALTVDPDGDDVTVAWLWTVDGVPVPDVQGPELPAGTATRDQVIVATAVPTAAGLQGAAVDSDPVVVANTVPSITGVSLTPADPVVGDTLTCAPEGWDDADGDAPSPVVTWFINGSSIPSVDDTLTAPSFEKGNAVQCRIAPDDGLSRGDAILSDVRTVGNTAPTLVSAAITPANPVSGDLLSISPVGLADADGDLAELRVRWLVDGVEVADPQGSDPSFAVQGLTPGQSIQASLVPTDGEADGTPVQTPAVVLQDTPPVASVTLGPAAPTVVDAVVATVVGSDADGEDVSFRYEWTVDGLPAGSDEAILPAGTAVRGQVVGLTVTPSTASGEGVPVHAEVAVVNCPPELGAASVSPQLPRVATGVSCVATGFFDADGDVESVRYGWQVGGVLVGVEGPTLPGDRLVAGDPVVCVATPVDAEGDGVPVVSDPVVLQNTPPVLTSASLDRSLLRTGEVLTAVLGPTADDDGDVVTVDATWFVDEVQVNAPLAQGLVLNAAGLTPGQVVRAVLTPTDGITPGESVSVGPLVVQNTPPTVLTASLSPADPVVTDSLTASATASDPDPNAGAPTLSFRFEVDGVVVQEGASNTLAAGTAAKGSRVVVEVTAEDGTDTSQPLRSEAVQVGNSSPTGTGAALSAASLREGDTVACLGQGFADADGDPSAGLVSWFVDGSAVPGRQRVPEDVSLSSQFFDRGQSVSCRWFPSDGEAEGPSHDSAPAPVLNTLPSLDAVDVSPWPPVAGQVSNASVQGLTDPDPADAVTVQWSWTVDGSEVSTTASLPSGLVVRGNEVVLTATPVDGVASGDPVVVGPVTVPNAVPEVLGMVITPPDADTTDALLAAAVGFDADGDALTYTFNWTLDGVSVLSGVGADRLAASFTERGVNVRVSATPNDGLIAGETTWSSVVRIGNAAPSAPVVQVAPEAPVQGTDALLCEVVQASVDPDVDGITYSMSWTRDGAAFNGTTDTVWPGDTVPAASVGTDEVWACTATASDGTDDGQPTVQSVTSRARTPLVMVDLPSTTFTLGSDLAELGRDAGEGPLTATRTTEVAVGLTEVTQVQYRDRMGYQPSSFANCGDDCPVEQVSWHEAAAFANALSDEEGLQSCYACVGADDAVTCTVAESPLTCEGYRLPTELEWESAADALGLNAHAFPAGGSLANASDASSCSPGVLLDNGQPLWLQTVGCTAGPQSGPQPVLSTTASFTLGLFDLSGNVAEWCHDPFGPYPAGPITDYTGFGGGADRVVRGGSWASAPGGLRSASRDHLLAGARRPTIGFRVARTVAGAADTALP